MAILERTGIIKMKLQLLRLPRCRVCVEVNRMLQEEIIPRFPDVEVETIDMTSEQGQKMLLGHDLATSPVLFIEGKLFASGPVDKNKLISKLQTL